MTVTTERSYTTIDKSKWGDGEWQSEPDKVQWLDDATGFDCLAVRGGGGAWCGYVGLPPGHPCYESGYDHIRVRDADGDEDWPNVHGGLTYDGFCQEGDDESKYVCHVPLEGRPEKVWWLGFDCNHSGDWAPGYRDHHGDDPMFSRSAWEAYRDLAYCQRETRKLAAQLADAYPAPPRED